MRKEQIEEFLKSDDLEMVRLGATFLQKFIPRARWNDILTSCSKRDPDTLGGFYNFTGGHKWGFEITADKRIIIKDVVDLSRGLWQQLGKNYKHTYKINTGFGGMSVIQKAIKEYYIKQKPTKHEQTKKKWYRQQSK